MLRVTLLVVSRELRDFIRFRVQEAVLRTGMASPTRVSKYAGPPVYDYHYYTYYCYY